jgi:hypothetical protein
VMPSCLVMSSMGPALRMGSLRVEILKPFFVIDVSASPGATVSAGAPFGVVMVGWPVGWQGNKSRRETQRGGCCGVGGAGSGVRSDLPKRTRSTEYCTFLFISTGELRFAI